MKLTVLAGPKVQELKTPAPLGKLLEPNSNSQLLLPVLIAEAIVAKSGSSAGKMSKDCGLIEGEITPIVSKTEPEQVKKDTGVHQSTVKPVGAALEGSPRPDITVNVPSIVSARARAPKHTINPAVRAKRMFHFILVPLKAFGTES